MSDFSAILDDLRDRMSDCSASFIGGNLPDEVYELIAKHAIEVTILRMKLFKNTTYRQTRP